MSEVDNLSDSDWLEIDSSLASTDNDSDSDHDEISSMPRSRRSSVSAGSSREGDVEAWEGFVEDSADEDMSLRETVHPISSAAGHSDPDTADTCIGQDPAEDQRVKDALDQSLISTLSASRSSGHASTTHNSLRDLRLSFPDPLTSSRDDLNRSYEEVSPSDTRGSVPDTTAGADEVSPTPPAPLLLTEDPGSLPTTPEVPHYEVQPHREFVNTGFNVVLYGSTSSIKWSFIQDLLQKGAAVSGLSLTHTSQIVNTSTRWLHFERSIGDHASLIESVAIIDKTDPILTRSEFVRCM